MNSTLRQWCQVIPPSLLQAWRFLLIPSYPYSNTYLVFSRPIPSCLVFNPFLWLPPYHPYDTTISPSYLPSSDFFSPYSSSHDIHVANFIQFLPPSHCFLFKGIKKYVSHFISSCLISLHLIIPHFTANLSLFPGMLSQNLHNNLYLTSITLLFNHNPPSFPTFSMRHLT